MRLVSIASGSSGNCVLIDSEDTRILVDVGISKKRVISGLNKVGLNLSDLDGIVITHEHSDHIKGLGVTLRQEEIEVYATKGTLNGIFKSSSLGKVNSSLFNEIVTFNQFNIGDIMVNPFDTYHDVNEPCGYSFTQKDCKAAVITDTGKFDVTILDALVGVNGLLIESNHDVDMLKKGDYPAFLKERILGDFGHMSNETCSKLLCEILNDNIEGIILGHLSEHNNEETLALETVKNGIDLNGCEYKAKDFNIITAKREDVTKPIDF